VADTPAVHDSDFRRLAQATLRACEQSPVEGLRSARALAKRWPDEAAAARLLAFVLRKANRLVEADKTDRQAVRLAEAAPAMAAVHVALAAGQLEPAEVLIRQHLRADPEDAYAAKLLADIAVRCGAIPQGETFYKRALLIAPGYHDARLALALLLNRSGREEEAFAAVDAVLARDGDHVGALSIKAGMLNHVRRLDEADKLFRKLVTAHPRDPVVWINYAYLLKTLNRTDESIAAYRKAIAFDKANGLAWFGLANLKTVRFDGADITAMEAALTVPGAGDEQRLHLHFALGKAYDDQRDYDAAFAHYRSGNALRRARHPYDAEAVSAEVRSVARLLTPALLSARDGAGATDPDPIFIVSLPRSGSTLVEQILASHPLVEGTEELYEIEAIARSITSSTEPAAWLDAAAKLPPATLRALGARYLENTRKYRTTGRPFFTDKMPGNWRYIALLRLILPNAKIVDVRRHPLGCGFANFAQHFNWGIDFSYDLSDIGRFYADYVRHMAHVDAVAPGRVHRVFYETLVDGFEPEVRRLLDHLGLPFDPACLAFHENRRPVHTPSAEQVRQPIYRAGVERWQRYEAHLGSLKAALGPVLDAYPDVPDRW
jgi:tetratricopeptide (TPR) repeat protein